jgi:hypothetical protein
MAKTLSQTGGYELELQGGATLVDGDGGNFRVAIPPWPFEDGKHLTLNGSSQYGTVAGLLDNPPASGCVSLWFKPGAQPVADATLLCKASSFSGATITNGLQVKFGSAPGRIEFHITKDGVTDTAQLDASVTEWAGWWHHLVVSWGTKLRIWLNGCVVAEAAHSGAWTNGSSAAFAIGAKLVATASNFCNVSVDEIEVRSAEPTRASVGKWFNREGLTQLYEHDRWVKQGVVIAPSVAGESTAVFEPKVVRKAAGDWVGCYSGGVSTPSIYGFTSTDGKTFTKTDRIMGQGTGGHSGAAVRPNIFRDDDGTLYLYWSDSIVTAGGSIWYATSADGGITWTRQAVVVAPSGNHNGYANSTVFRDGDIYHWLIEFVPPTSAVDYTLAYFTSDSPTGPLTLVNDTLLKTTLKQRGAMSTGHLLKIGDKFHFYSHQSRFSNAPTHAFHNVSEDLIRWDQRGGADPVIDLEEFSILARQDQVADMFLYELPDSGEVGLLYDIDDNNGGGYIARCCLATFSGSLSDLA